MSLIERAIRTFLFLLSVVLPVLAGYVIYDQLRTPAFDASIELETGRILAVAPNSYANWAGFRPGDTILAINDEPYPHWPSDVGNYPARVQRGTRELTLEIPLVALATINLASLLNGMLVALTFWGVGVFLLWRRFQQYALRIFFLLTQSIGIGLLFFLAYPEASERPAWMMVAISAGFHLAAALVVHYYLTFPVVLGSACQRRWAILTLYSAMLVALALRVSAAPFGVRISFFINTLELIVASGLAAYVYRYRASPDDRRRLRIIVFGNIASLGPLFILYLLPTILGIHRVPDWVVGPFMIITPLCYFTAIARYHLFGIDRFLNRALVYAALWLGILLLYLGPFLLIVRFVPGDWLAQMLVSAGLTLLVGLSFERTKAALQRIADRIFYGGWYDYPGVIESATRSLAACTDSGQLAEVLTRQVPELMQLQGAELIFDGDALPATTCYSLAFQGKVRAHWRLFPHRDRDELTDSDRRILKTLVCQAEIALGNVLLIETLRAQLDEIRASREALSQAQHRLLRSREEERARLARDLHDGPLQSLIGLNLQLGLLQPSLADSQALKEMRAEVRDLLTDLRGVCSELRPPMLDTLGLAAALRSLAEDWSAQSGVVLRLDLPTRFADLPTLPGDTSVNLYRVAQEALANVARHAEAQQVSIRLASEDGGVRLMIEDDGCGFNLPGEIGELTASGHFGLVGLRERVNLIGGKLSLNSAPGRGTCIQVEWRSPG